MIKRSCSRLCYRSGKNNWIPTGALILNIFASSSSKNANMKEDQSWKIQVLSWLYSILRLLISKPTRELVLLLRLMVQRLSWVETSGQKWKISRIVIPRLIRTWSMESLKELRSHRRSVRLQLDATICSYCQIPVSFMLLAQTNLVN